MEPRTENISFFLVSSTEPGNIGAAARRIAEVAASNRVAFLFGNKHTDLTEWELNMRLGLCFQIEKKRSSKAASRPA